MRFEKMYAKVAKFHGKPKKITVKTDDGTEEEFNIYPMPMRFLPDTLAIQKIASNAPKKESGEPDLEALSIEDKAELQKLNMETAKATLAFSMLIDTEGKPYQEVATLPEADFEEAKQIVSTMTMNGLQKILLAMSEVNNIDLQGDGQKKAEVSQEKN
jgi:hypothetical protein